MLMGGRLSVSKIFLTSDTHFGHDREFIWKVRGFNSVKESRSVFMNLIEDIAIDNGEDNSQELIDKILVDHNTCNDFDNILIKEEARIYLDQLKEYDEFIYKLVVESVINETTKKDLAKKYNMTPGQISRRINKGINMIRENIKNNN
jgi:DNA-directed RNA polymerase specialized sigma subunit